LLHCITGSWGMQQPWPGSKLPHLNLYSGPALNLSQSEQVKLFKRKLWRVSTVHLAMWPQETVHIV
jgi:hypothetical protein